MKQEWENNPVAAAAAAAAVVVVVVCQLLFVNSKHLKIVALGNESTCDLPIYQRLIDI